MKYPDYLVTTGDYVREWMEEEGINADELASHLGISGEDLGEVLSGQKELTPEMATSLAVATGIPARLWNLYEARYRDALTRQ